MDFWLLWFVSRVVQKRSLRCSEVDKKGIGKVHVRSRIRKLNGLKNSWTKDLCVPASWILMIEYLGKFDIPFSNFVHASAAHLA